MLSTPRIIGLLAIIAVLGAAVVWIYREGGEDVRNSIERQNNEAGDISDRARTEFDMCLDSGGVWSNSTRKCARPPARRGN